MTRTSYYFGPLTALLAAVGVAVLVLVMMVSAEARPAQAQSTTTGTTITVTTNADEENSNNKCSLREAIKAANTNQKVDACPAGSATGEDSIRFDLGSSATITLDQALGELGVSDAAGLVVNGKAKGADVTVSGNDAVRVFFVDEGAKLALRNLTVVHGNADSGGYYNSGGGLRNLGTVEVSNSTFSDNRANNRHGGGIDNLGTLTVSDSTFSNNSAASWGGAIHNSDYDSDEGISQGILKVSNTTFSKNSASFGGGIFNQWGTLEASGSTFSENSASATGGGIYHYKYTVMLANSTFSENSARYGAGIYISAGTLEASYSTFSQNSASYSGDGVANYGTATLSSTIVADSTPSIDNCYGSPPITDGRYNISSDASCNFTDPTSKNDTDPRLDPRGLRDNGGPTETIALQREKSSAALGEIPEGQNGCGTEIKTDQRGVKRPQDKDKRCDIGAFERKPRR